MIWWHCVWKLISKNQHTLNAIEKENSLQARYVAPHPIHIIPPWSIKNNDHCSIKVCTSTVKTFIRKYFSIYENLNVRSLHFENTLGIFVKLIHWILLNDCSILFFKFKFRKLRRHSDQFQSDKSWAHSSHLSVFHLFRRFRYEYFLQAAGTANCKLIHKHIFQCQLNQYRQLSAIKESNANWHLDKSVCVEAGL